MSESVSSLEDLSRLMDSMHGVVNLDAASALLQGLLTQISRQNIVMSQMQEEISQMMPRREHEIVVHRLEDKIQQLQQDVQKAQKAATASLLDQE